MKPLKLHTDRKYRTKVTIPSVILLIYCWMSHKVQFNTLFYSTFTSVIFSFLVEGDNVTSYVDDTTPYSNGKNVVTVSEKIETKGKDVV